MVTGWRGAAANAAQQAAMSALQGEVDDLWSDLGNDVQSVVVGSVSALAAAATPTVTNSGTSTHVVLDFGIPAGAAGATLVGSVSIGQTAVVAIALGIREVTAALTGTVVGAKYIAFATSYQLNGGGAVNGRPSGYALIDCVCNTAGQITISLSAPLLAIGASYAITCAVVRINA